jgi:catechol 2,3-dioxygenase
METLVTISATTEAQATQLLPAETRLGPVHLAVTDPDRARLFWTQVLGLTELESAGDTIRLGAGDVELIVLHPGAAGQVPHGRTGLYHVAIHLPTRKELARATARLFAYRYANSPTDHTVSETTYLSDPDSNGIELTLETPERGEFVIVNGQYMARTADGEMRSGRDPVDLESLFGELADEDDLNQPMPAGTRIGHVHLHVRDLEEAERFYSDLIGFRLALHMPAIGMSDFTLDRHMIPHALAINTWMGPGASPPPEGVAGLRRYTIELPTSTDIEAVTNRLQSAGHQVEPIENGIRLLDPSRNPLHIITPSGQ